MTLNENREMCIIYINVQRSFLLKTCRNTKYPLSVTTHAREMKKTKTIKENLKFQVENTHLIYDTLEFQQFDIKQ